MLARLKCLLRGKRPVSARIEIIMKFAIINDMHVGTKESGYFKGIQRKLTGEAERLIKKFVEEMNESEKPEFVINLGDSIEDLNDREMDFELFDKGRKLLAGLKMPCYTLIGNHDVRTLAHGDIAKLFGYGEMYYSFDQGQYHFVALSFVMTGNHTVDLGDIFAEVPADQLEWLAEDLAKTKKPTVVFMHYGLAEDDMKGNFWFETAPEKGLLSNRAQVRKIFEDSGKVRAVFTAHQHWNRMHEHAGIPYFTVTSLVENFNNDGVPAEAYTIVNLKEDKIRAEVKGNDPAEYEYDLLKRYATIK